MFAQSDGDGFRAIGGADFRKENRGGRTPKTLGFLVILGLQSRFAAVAAASITPRDYRQPETTNFEKVGPTYFLNCSYRCLIR